MKKLNSKKGFGTVEFTILMAFVGVGPFAGGQLFGHDALVKLKEKAQTIEDKQITGNGGNFFGGIDIK